jgi:hypothetical protein
MVVEPQSNGITKNFLAKIKMINENQIYIGTYKVIRFYKSGRKVLIEKGLTREQAIEKTKQFESTKTSFVGFDKQFTSSKYFK